MKRILTAAACSFLAAAFLVPPLPAQEAAESCRVCHKDALSLEEWNADELAARLKELRDGVADHVVPIPELSDQEVEALAAALAGS